MMKKIANIRAYEWQNYLSDSVFERLCDCISRKADMIELTKAFYYHSDKGQQMSKKEALDYMLEWVLDWNSGEWDYTSDEYEIWLANI